MGQDKPGKFQLLTWKQGLFLLLILVVGFSLTWFASKNILNSFYQEQKNEFRINSKQYTNRFNEQLIRIEDALFNTQSFFRASNDVTREELQTFVNNSQLDLTKSSPIDSLFFINKINTQPNTTTEQITHQVEQVTSPYFLHNTANMERTDVAKITDQIKPESVLQQSKQGPQFKSSIIGVLGSQDRKNIHFIIPLKQNKNSEVFGYIGTTFSLSKYLETNRPQKNYVVDLAISASDQNNISLSVGSIVQNNIWLEQVTDFLEVSKLEEKSVFSFGNLGWTFDYNTNITANAPLWLQVMPFLLLLAGGGGTILVVITLLVVFTDRSRVKKKVAEKTQELRVKGRALESVNDGVIVTDTLENGTKTTYVNKGFEEITGYSEDEFVGKNCNFLQGEETDPEKVKKMREKLEQEESFQITLINYRKNGEKFWNELSVSPVYDDVEELVGFIGIQRDVTKQKQREWKLEEKVEEIEKLNQKMQKEKAKDEAILYSIGEGLVVTDEEGKVEFVNDGFEDILGKSKQEVIEQHIAEATPVRNEDKEEVNFESEILSQVLEENKEVKSEQDYYFAREDGSIFPVSITVSPIELDGEVIGAVEVFRDTTKIRELDKAKDEFVSLASHQLRTPLSTISWYAEMLLDGDAGELTDEQEEFIEEIYNGNQRMIGLVSALLNVSRIESGSLMVKREEVDLIELTHNTLKDVEPKVNKKELTVHEDYDQNTPVIKGDQRILRIILQNLISNAVKYTPQEGDIGINIFPNNQEEMVQVEVWDEGYGIPEEQQDQIFEKLFRADNIETKDTTGTGLGLYVVKSILEKTGGDIWFESEEGEGTTFYVQIPFSGMKEQDGSKSLAFGEVSQEEQDSFNK